MACGLHGPHSCSPAWGDLRLPGMGCISSFPPSSWQGTGRELGREHTLPKAALKPAWQTQTCLWGPQSPLVSLVPAEEGRREGERGTHTTGAAFPFLTAPHGVLLTRPLVALHLGVAAFLLCRVIAAVMPVAAPGRQEKREFGCPPASCLLAPSLCALLTQSSRQQCSPWPVSTSSVDETSILACLGKLTCLRRPLMPHLLP